MESDGISAEACTRSLLINRDCTNYGHSSPPRQGQRVDPFLWDSEDGMVDLGSFGGTCGFTNSLNDRGQAVGQSYLKGNTAAHAFLWDKNGQPHMKDLGTLGGDNASATWLNGTGDAFGYADLFNAHVYSGLTCVHHGFLWQNGLMTDLCSLGTDPRSRALSINGKGQVIGAIAAVCGGNSIHGFPWEHGGPAIDLNSLVQPGVDLALSEPIYIREQGEIAGNGALPNDTTATVDVSTTTSFPQNAAAVNPRASGHRYLNVAFGSASHGVFVA